MSKAVYRDHMGTDLTVVNNARVSFSKRSELVDGKLKEADERLIQYLARGLTRDEWMERISYVVDAKDQYDASAIIHDLMSIQTHWAPFAGTSIQLEVSAPVPIRTQCFKHKVGFVESEESRRYIKSTPELYIPECFHYAPDSAKQGAGNVHAQSTRLVNYYETVSKMAISAYEYLIDEGVAPEEARFILPQGVMVNWIWTGSLASYARYYNQRSDSHAQTASRDLAEQIADIVYSLFPVSWMALCPSYVEKEKLDMATPVTKKQIPHFIQSPAFDKVEYVHPSDLTKIVMNSKPE